MAGPYKLVMTRQARIALMLGGAVAFVAAVAIAGSRSGWGPPSSGAPLAVGQTAPDFDFRTMDGQSISRASLKGKPVMIDFWATWCGPCVEALPDTERIAKTYPNVTVLAVSQESKGDVEQFLSSHPFKLTFCLDHDGQANDAYGVTGIPCRVFIDASGKVEGYVVGYDENDPDVQAALDKIGAQKG